MGTVTKVGECKMFEMQNVALQKQEWKEFIDKNIRAISAFFKCWKDWSDWSASLNLLVIFCKGAKGAIKAESCTLLCKYNLILPWVIDTGIANFD